MTVMQVRSRTSQLSSPMLSTLKLPGPEQALTLTQKGKSSHPNQTVLGTMVGPSTSSVMTMIVEIPTMDRKVSHGRKENEAPRSHKNAEVKG